MLKVYRFIFDGDTGRIERTARDTLDFAHETISQLKEEGDPMPVCLLCGTPVPLPCWCCVECPGEWGPGKEELLSLTLCTAAEKFICDDCEHKQLAFGKTHTRMHTIVRVSDDVAKELSTEERLRLVEDELARARQTLQKLFEKGEAGSVPGSFPAV